VSDGTMKLVKGQGRESAELPPDEDLWDVKRAAQFLGLSVDGVYRAAERGEIPSVRVLNRRRFIPAKLRAWAHSLSEGERR
jgi:excisionase family DNA binding protein